MVGKRKRMHGGKWGDNEEYHNGGGRGKGWGRGITGPLKWVKRRKKN